MILIEYAFLFILSFLGEFVVAASLIRKTSVQITDKGYKINFDLLKKLLTRKSSVIAKILDFIPGINIINCYITAKNKINSLWTNPEFIANLIPLEPLEEEFLQAYKEKEDIKSTLEQLSRVIYLFDEAEIKAENVDIGSYSKRELKKQDLHITKNVIDKMLTIDEEHPFQENKTDTKTFYTLPDNYNLSNIMLIDENATFIKTPEEKDAAVINTDAEEVSKFAKNSLVVKPSLDTQYQVISFKPFNKDKVRKALFEIEYNKSLLNLVIDTDKFKISEPDDTKRKTL